MTSDADKKAAAAESAMGEPVLAEFSEDLRRTKRNLLIVSSVVIFSHAAGIKVTEAGFFGFKFTNPDQVWLNGAAMAFTGYLLAQFCWQMWDHLQHTRIRLTGVKLAHVTVGKISTEYGDYPDDPRQSSLYNWWSEHARRIGNLSEIVDRLHNGAERLEELANRPGNIDQPNIGHVTRRASEINAELAHFRIALERTRKTIESTRIPASLERFDRWFQCFRTSQVWRLFVLDIALPFLLGSFAFVWSLRAFF